MDPYRIARNIMVTPVFSLSPETHVIDGMAFLLRHGISGAPVVDAEGNYLGVFSEKCSLSVLHLSSRLAQENHGSSLPITPVKNFMATRLITLSPRMDVFNAVDLLLKHHISGAPVIDEQDHFLGVLSERYSMRVMIDAAYDQLPTSEVAPFMNTDQGRVIDEDRTVLEVAKIFLETPYRRLEVVKEGKLIGQISRRDVLRAEHHLAELLRDREALLLDNSDQILISDLENAPLEKPLPSSKVSAFMDVKARTITEDLDLLGVAQIFLNTNYRRLPVLREGKLVGQISRRDVLKATHDLMQVSPARESALLYLSALVERNEAPIV
ncbi:MAG: CBS domain-containing protein [Planctomycetaceae bacterium]|nr:CBS domain-containing protein [Planctomycetaceae bacterium]